MASVTCTWTVPADGGSPIDGYRLERQVAGGAFELLASPSTNSTSYVDTTAAAATQYAYRVAAVTAAGVGAWSAVQTLTTGA